MEVVEVALVSFFGYAPAFDTALKRKVLKRSALPSLGTVHRGVSRFTMSHHIVATGDVFLRRHRVAARSPIDTQRSPEEEVDWAGV